MDIGVRCSQTERLSAKNSRGRAARLRRKPPASTWRCRRCPTGQVGGLRVARYPGRHVQVESALHGWLPTVGRPERREGTDTIRVLIHAKAPVGALGWS